MAVITGGSSGIGPIQILLKFLAKIVKITNLIPPSAAPSR